MKRFYLTALSCAFLCTGSVYATTYARWTFDEPTGTQPTGTVNSGVYPNTWSTNFTTGGGGATDGQGNFVPRTRDGLESNVTYWSPGVAMANSGVVYLTVKFSKFKLNLNPGAYGELFRLSANNASGSNHPQAMIYLRRKVADNTLEVCGFSSSTATSSSGTSTPYVQLHNSYSLPSGLILTMALDYTNLTYNISAKVGDGDWRHNICTGTLYSGAVFSGMRLQLGWAYDHADDDVRVDEISATSVHPDRDVTDPASSVGGSLSISGSLDLLGNEITFGNGSGLYGAGLLYDPVDGSLIFDLPKNTASWLWQRGSETVMGLDSSNRLSLLGQGGHLTLDPSGTSYLGALDLTGGLTIRDNDGAIQIASNRISSRAYTEGGGVGGSPTDLRPLELDVSEVTGSAVSVVSSPNKLVKTNSEGKIDYGFLDLGLIHQGVALSDTDGSIDITPHNNGQVRINSTAYSDSPVTGALVVHGGVGVSGAIRTADRMVVERSGGAIEIGGEHGGDPEPVIMRFSGEGVEAFFFVDTLSGSLMLADNNNDHDANEGGRSGIVAIRDDIVRAGSESSSAGKLVRAKATGKIDQSFLPTVIRVAPAGDLSMGVFRAGDDPSGP